MAKTGPRAASAEERLEATRSALTVIAALAGVILACSGLTCLADETNSAATAPPARTEDTNSEQMLRTYLQLQEQIHSLQLEVQESRKQGDAAAARNTDAVAGRLQAIEESLASQRAHEFDALSRSNHVMQIVAGTFAAVGFLAILLMGYFQWRTVSRLAEVSPAIHSGIGLGARPAVAAIGTGEAAVVASAPVEQSNLRLLGAIDQLERRILQLEHTTRPTLSETLSASNGSEASPSPVPTTVEAPAPAASEAAGSADDDGLPPKRGVPPAPAAIDAEGTGNGDKIGVLLAKGQSLLNLDKAEEALACFDEVLALEPKSADALVKKGTALERLRKPAEAIECYDRAIAADSSLTIAWLYKGGLFNRMERFTEALECYEQALRTQERRA